MPKFDHSKTTEGRVPLTGLVRNGKLAAILDHEGNDLGMPVTATASLTGGSKISMPGKRSVFQPAAATKWVLNFSQAPGTGNPIDLSGNGALCNILEEYTDAAAWANKGYLTAGTTAGYYACVPNSQFAWDLAADSIIFSTVINKATPAGNESFLGCCNTTTRYGIYLQAKTTGKIRVFVNSTGGYVSGLADSTAVFCDGADHTLTLMLHGPTRSIFLFCDGQLSDQFIGAWTGGGTVTSNLSFGTTNDTGTAGTPVACKFGKAAHFLKFANAGLPINAAEVARKLHQEPMNPLTDDDIGDTASEVWTLAVCGQSNEKGSGTRADRVGNVGCPVGDAIGPYGTAGQMSMWPRVAERAGKKNIWMPVANTARGSSSIANHWCGRIVAWSASARIAHGQYCLAAGNIYKAAAAGNTNGTTAGTVPTWPGSGSVVDSQITWSYVRAATGADVVGKIMQEGDDLFDPNGYIAGLVSYSATIPTATKRLVYLAFGQEDGTRQTARADYAQSIKNIIAYLKARGYITVVGMSFYCAAVDSRYSSDLIPGMQDALAAYSGDSSVKAGANLRALLGVLATSPSRGTLGLQADALHATNETYAVAASYVADAVLT